jgi:predicted transcriptional regulator
MGPAANLGVCSTLGRRPAKEKTVGTRRPVGGLEEEVMQYLWAADVESTPAEVHKVVCPELAYTTVMTVLTRLYEKGQLERGRRGRAYTYRPVRTEAEYRASSMQTALSDAQDRSAVLSSFVESLDGSDLSVLRKLLKRS